MNIFKRSIAFHKKYRGKVAIKSKVPLRNRDDLSLAYTPGVAGACLKIAESPELVYQYTFKANSVAIVSDGSAVLGLGNIGAKAAIPVMEGKAVLFKEFGGLDAFPICLQTNDVEEIIRTIKLIAPNFGGINLEDISAPRCFEIERRLKKELDIPIMHDDQWGTATVVLAALKNAVRLRGLKTNKARVVINGAGAAGNAVARILIASGFKDIILIDSQGIIWNGRAAGMDSEKRNLALLTNPRKIKGGLTEAIKGSDIFIGVSRGNLLKQEMIRLMNPKPIIFALANPTPEIMPDAARRAGAFIIATGRSDFPNQINNLLAFPGLFRGALDKRIKKFEEKMFIRAAEAIARKVKHPTPDKIVPSALDKKVAAAVAKSI